MKKFLHNNVLLCLISLLLCGHFDLIASNKAGTLIKQKDTKSGFIENKGQIIDQNNKPNSAVLYLLNTPGMNVQLRKGGFSYDLYQVKPPVHVTRDNFSHHSSRVPHSDSIRFNRIDIDLINANHKSTVETGVPSKGYLNYYTMGTPVEGVTSVRSYSSVTYKNIYPGIDLQFIGDERQFEYNFILQPGANINSIKLKVSGPEKIRTFREGIHCETQIGDIDETIPVCYYTMNDTKVQVKGRFKKIADHIYGFSTDQIIPSAALLLIDPYVNRIWGTYYGGSQDDANEGGLAVDKFHNVIFVGYASSTNNIASVGAYQTVYGGNSDGFIAKMTANGQRIWGTYYGGEAEDDLWSCCVDTIGNIYAAGVTNSLTGISSPGAHQVSYAGNQDAFLVKLNSNGQRIWATYYGGTELDACTVCTTDRFGNVIISGNTGSTTNIATPGSYQPNIFNNNYDAYVAKFDSSGTLLWGTYFGGDGDDDTYGCITDTNGTIYIAGNTKSTVNIATALAQQPVYGGQTDAFLASISSNGQQRIWGTYYGGHQEDDGQGLDIDKHGNLYLAGITLSDNAISTPGSFQPLRSGGDDAFLVKFTNSGQRVWGTYYGGTLSDNAMGCSTGNNGDIFICGTTKSTNNIATPGSFSSSYNGGMYDGYLAKFDSLGMRVWGTYYGGPAWDAVFQCFYVPDDTLYLVGYTISTTNIATNNTFQPVLGGSDDAFLAKLMDCTAPITAGPISGPDTICFPSSPVTYSIPALTNAWNYAWTLPPGLTITGGAGTRSITVNISASASSGWIKVNGIDKCGDSGPSDSLYVILGTAPVPVIFGPNITCAGTGKIYTTASGKSNYQWSISAGGLITSGGTSSDNTVTVSWTVAGTQHVYLNYSEISGCTGSTPTDYSVTVSASPVVSVSINTPSNSVCAGTSVTFTATPINGGGVPSYQWMVNGINTGTGLSAYSYVPLNMDVISCILTSSIIGCIMHNPDTSNSIVMTVNAVLPVSISISASANPICQGVTVTFTATPANGGGLPAYQWKVNGLNVGTNSTSYTYNPANGDQVTCQLNSSVTCPTGNPASSNTITMTVNPVLLVSLTISASANPLCLGSQVTFMASPINGGGLPAYQWIVNGLNVGTNSSSYTYNPANGDNVSCILNSSVTCATGNPATSNSVTMTVNSILPVSITISPSANPYCQGSTVIFTGIPISGGPIPAFQWKVNGLDVGTNNSSYSYIPANGDLVSCVLTSSATCTSGNPALSNTITMIENSSLPAGVSITASSNPFCPGSSVTFTANPTNGGAAPVYSWKVNGANVGTNSTTYSDLPANGDSIRCVMTSNLACVTGNPASSAEIIMSGTLASVVTFTSCFDTITAINAKPIRLRGGIPLGGTYSGPGVNSGPGIFTPSLAGTGTKTITYTYTNAAMCSASKNMHIIVQASAAFICGNNLIDIRDNTSYTTIKIGSQCWLAKNLDYGIIIASSQDQRDNCVPEKYCYQDNPINCGTQGGLYQWDKLMQFDNTPADQGLCPPAWHIPTENDWNTLFANYINSGFAGSPLKYSGFSGFNALLYGARHINSGWDFNGFATFFWSSTSYGGYKAWAHGLNESDPSVSVYPASRVNAFSVRCVED